MSINLKNKQDIIKEFGANEKDTGSVEVQIAMLSQKISELTEHLKSNQKDGLFIKTANGVLKVLEIQGENSKRMSINDFLRGNPIKEFEVFE